MVILITGFEAFDRVDDNPSQRIVEYFVEKNPPEIITDILPVAYELASDRVGILIEVYQPKAVLLLGVAQKRTKIALERVAINIQDASIPDNTGRFIKGKRIIEDAPVGYWSSLPLGAMYDAIDAEDIPVKFSNHAGTFLCNQVMYDSLHYLARIKRHTPCGFIHVPGVEHVPLKDQIKAIELCIEVVMREEIKL